MTNGVAVAPVPFLAWAGLFVAVLVGGCDNSKAPRASVKARPAASGTAKTTPRRPAIAFSKDRISFTPAPIEALETIAPERPLVRSLLNVNHTMTYGDFVWNDRGVGPGKVWALVDLAAQTISVFRDGQEIGRAVTLFGADGYSTPTGRFPILSRATRHVSSVYKVSMPYTLRLTNDGISIHASNVRGGVGTHGCVGVPAKFAAKLFDAMKVGDEVMIIPDRSRPRPRTGEKHRRVIA
ncbi:MAG: L,D-transpeptidase family protein [Pseudomonadota bacterium]|nr:L,D-transpeptidase family protein [Pseudomonadota bacterium]